MKRIIIDSFIRRNAFINLVDAIVRSFDILIAIEM